MGKVIVQSAKAARSQRSLIFLLQIGLTSLLLVLFSQNLFGQFRVSTCEELNLRPIEPGTGNDLLAIYLDGDGTGLGGFGCWVHHHPNGQDYVVTPHSWGREPNPGKMALISDAMQTITDARRVYPEYGTLNNDLYYILDDVNRRSGSGETTSIKRGQTFWLVGNQCWMQSGAPSLRLESSNRERRLHTYAHEIGHCFVMENVPDLGTYYSGLNHWFDESVSEFLSSELYKNNDGEHQWAEDFDLDGKAFTQPYRAYSLWYYYARKYGKESVVRLMNELAALGSREQRLSHLRRLNFDLDYHHYLLEYYQQYQ